MSHTSGTSDQEDPKRTTKSNVFTSTPIDDASANTISLSRIGTSSLSGDRIEDRLQSQTIRRRIKKRKKVSKNKRKSLYKKRIVRLNDTERVTSTEWSTELEEEAVNDDVPEDDYINLFDDPCTPEKIRDAPITYESPIHHSPILRSSNRFYVTSKRSILQHHELLQVDVSEKRVGIDEDKIMLNRTNNVKTYKNPKDKEKNSQCSLPIYWSAVPCPPPCFSMSDLLWEKFVKENREEMPEHLASCSARVMYKESDFLRKHPNIPPRFEDESSPDPPGTICIRGYSDSNAGECVTNVYYTNEEKKMRQMKTKGRKRNKRKRKEITLESTNETVYDVEDERDVEFETGGRNGGRITLFEFRQKCKRKC